MQAAEFEGDNSVKPEGINVFVAGIRDKIDQLIAFFESLPEYSDLPIKESCSEEQPFSRMLVRIKKEIIAFGVPGIQPHRATSPNWHHDN